MRRKEFSTRTKLATYERANGRCEACSRVPPLGRIEYDHRIPCELGGDNKPENCVLLCRDCHKLKSKDDMKDIAKSRHVRAKHWGAKGPSKRPIAGSKRSKWKKRIDGTVVLR